MKNNRKDMHVSAGECDLPNCPLAHDLTRGECGVTKVPGEFYDLTASEPHCKECIDGFWAMMGDDPCGKDWR